MFEESVSFIPSHSLSDVPLHKPRLATFCTSKTLQWIFVEKFPRDTGQNTFFGNLARCMSPPSRITNHRCFISEEVLCFLKPCWKVIMMGRTGKNSKWTIIIRILKNAQLVSRSNWQCLVPMACWTCTGWKRETVSRLGGSSSDDWCVRRIKECWGTGSLNSVVSWWWVMPCSWPSPLFLELLKTFSLTWRLEDLASWGSHLRSSLEELQLARIYTRHRTDAVGLGLNLAVFQKTFIRREQKLWMATVLFNVRQDGWL